MIMSTDAKNKAQTSLEKLVSRVQKGGINIPAEVKKLARSFSPKDLHGALTTYDDTIETTEETVVKDLEGWLTEIDKVSSESRSTAENDNGQDSGDGEKEAPAQEKSWYSGGSTPIPGPELKELDQKATKAAQEAGKAEAPKRTRAPREVKNYRGKPPITPEQQAFIEKHGGLYDYLLPRLTEILRINPGGMTPAQVRDALDNLPDQHPRWKAYVTTDRQWMARDLLEKVPNVTKTKVGEGPAAPNLYKINTSGPDQGSQDQPQE
jgi:hypothetical protein